MRYKHVIWDFDGTLFDTYPIMAGAFCDALREIGIDEPTDNIFSLMKISIGSAIEHYREKYKIGGAFLEKYERDRLEVEKRKVQPFDGILELCRNISESGGKNYLYTHRGESSFYFLEKFGLDKYFTDFVTKTDNFPRKPSPDAILYLAEKHGMLSDDAIMIGDRDVDILAAKNAGVDGRLVAPEMSGLAGLFSFLLD
ncbi:phosphoglycolate phosphatase [Clostridia bacterium]|nr:phosphoglycolate phosphatase [Clostridia bacterium]